MGNSTSFAQGEFEKLVLPLGLGPWLFSLGTEVQFELFSDETQVDGRHARHAPLRLGGAQPAVGNGPVFRPMIPAKQGFS